MAAVSVKSLLYMFFPFVQSSGTYNNQYMLLDLKKVQLKKSLLTGALWVVEQIPGYVLTMIKKTAVCC